MDSQHRYDVMLASIAVMIALMLTGLIVSSPVALIPGIVGAALVGIAMFVIPPVADHADRKI